MQSSFRAEHGVERERKSRRVWRTSPQAYKSVPTHEAYLPISRQRPAVPEHSLKTQHRVSVVIFRVRLAVLLLERVFQCTVVKTGGSQLQNWGGLAGPRSDDRTGSKLTFSPSFLSHHDGCLQIHRRVVQEEAVGRPPFPAPCPVRCGLCTVVHRAVD